MRVRRFPVVLVLAVLGAAAAWSDGPDGAAARAALAPPVDTDCPEPPPGSYPAEYRILLTQTQAGRVRPTPLSKAQPERLYPVRDRQQIREEAEYVSVFGAPSQGIDWSVSRILVVELTTTYKLNALDSAVTLSGIHADADAIYVRLSFTQYGPCQGIAQQAEWYSYDRTDVFVLLPALPAEISFYYCIIGGCPPDIP
jgi:hypothetical protein